MQCGKACATVVYSMFFPCFLCFCSMFFRYDNSMLGSRGVCRISPTNGMERRRREFPSVPVHLRYGLQLPRLPVLCNDHLPGPGPGRILHPYLHCCPSTGTKINLFCLFTFGYKVVQIWLGCSIGIR